MNGSCSECCAIGKLIKHHTSYQPEITTLICRKCHGKYTTKGKSGSRGFGFIRIYPSGMASISKDFFKQFGSLAELHLLNFNPVGIIFKAGLDLEYVVQTIDILKSSLELYRKK